MNFNEIYFEYDKLCNEYFDRKNIDEIKEKSQYFTPLSVSKKLYEGLEICGKRVIKILDPACGGGILVLKLVELILEEHKPEKILIHIYDIDDDVIKIAKRLLDRLSDLIEDIQIEVFCKCSDYLQTNIDHTFDYIVMNPPFKKVTKENAINYSSLDYRKYINGQPNLYHLFIAKSLDHMEIGGCLCIISPKNYLSGRYTERLRKYIVDNFSVTRVHTLNNRTSVFNYKITQEICMVHIMRKEVSNVLVSYNGFNTFSVDLSNLIINNTTKILLTPRYEKDIDLLSMFSKFPVGTIGREILMKTGRVVQFRVKNKENVLLPLEFTSVNNGIPLIIYRHINKKEFSYETIKDKAECAITIRDEKCNDTLFIENSNYVLLRKATDKKYNKLILSVPYLRFLESERIALDNSLAYFTGANRELTVDEVKGLNCVLQSEQFDSYYRMFNSTNALNIYEFENMNFPDIETIRAIGESIIDTYVTVEQATKIFSRFLS